MRKKVFFFTVEVAREISVDKRVRGHRETVNDVLGEWLGEWP
jgi:hypothetical protein